MKTCFDSKWLHQAAEKKQQKDTSLSYSAKGWFFFNRLLTGLLVLHFKHLTQAVEWKGDKILDFDWISIVAKCKNKYKHYEEIKKKKNYYWTKCSTYFFKSVQILKKKISFLPHMKVKNQLSSIPSTGIMFKYWTACLFKEYISSITTNISAAVRISQRTTANWRKAFVVVLTGSVAVLWPFACFYIQLLTSRV